MSKLIRQENDESRSLKRKRLLFHFDNIIKWKYIVFSEFVV